MKIHKKVTLMASAIFYSIVLSSQVFGQDAPTLSDPEIASVAVVANQNDIDFAGIAMQKSHNPKILKFAQTMMTDHKAIIDLAVALVTKLEVTPKDNAVSKGLLAEAGKTKTMLNSKPIKEFDKAYVDNEVAYHKAVIVAVKTVLVPQSQNSELKALLQKVVPILEAHLEHAEMVQKNMN
jgi:putative membrane protein